ncbi:MAG TPA: tetratricopeptide repeat protein [Kofleriaceae bacterium]|nr:tetratricopeptide repeat protein [Kofleriaceae bacterium]
MKLGAILVVVIAATSAARADDNGYLGKDQIVLEIDQCPPKPDLDDNAMFDAAHEHYVRGAILYQQGDYDGAIAEMSASYCLTPVYDVLKAIGQAHERKLHYEQAIAYFERYVLAIPDSAKDAAQEKQTISTRILVLQNLPSQIQVATLPKGALVTFADDAGHRAEGRADAARIELVAGHYTMSVSMAGFDTQEQPVDIGIGKPYSFVVELPPQRGRVHIRTTPADARIFMDDRLVGIGSWEDSVPAARYVVSVEAPGFVTEKRRVEVAPGANDSIAITLENTPSSGRGQLIAAATVAGLVGGVSIGYAVDDQDSNGALYGGGAGAAVGLIGSWVGVPDDIPSGTSSYVITSSLIGYVEGVAGTSIFTDDQQLPGAVGVVGLLGGASFAALTAERFHPDSGDAALLNSGALWGGATGGLFAVVFGLPKKLSGAIIVSGLDAGVITGALLARRYDISRRHAALVDLAGLAGMAVGVSLESAIDANRTDAVPKERIAHFALGGLAVGLVAGVYLTRNLDEPRATKLSPQITPMVDSGGHSIVGLGVGGSF